MKTKVFKLSSLVLIAGFFSVSISSCNSCKKAKQEEPKIAKETIKKEIEDYSYPLPSAFEVTNMLNSIEASYIVGIANDSEKADKYFSEKSKAINLGIYTADLAYATTYNQKSDIQNYFKASETLVRELDFTAAFDENLPDQIDANLDNKEKLVDIVTDMFNNAYSFLNKQGRTEVSYLVLSGTVIEGLYLTTHISENTFQNPKIIEAILFQKEPLAKLEKLIENYKDSELSKELYQDIKKINAIYAMEEGTTSFSREQVTKLTSTLDEIRGRLVK